LYAHFITLVQVFSHLGAWQKRGLALWCCGVLMAQRCQIAAVADALISTRYPSVKALEKRLGRFLHNPRISDELLTQRWIGWIVRTFASPHWVVLVDETKLSDRLATMMVGLAYGQRAIPLLWRCYSPDAYPAEGQVKLIGELLTRLRLLVPLEIQFTVQADRGIGTSPDLIRVLDSLKIFYLLRVQGHTRIRLGNGRVHTLTQLVQPGQTWCGRAEVFKKAGWMRLYVRLLWQPGQRGPWCLVSNCFWHRPHDYALRAWHEHSFRDLKSFGFHWDLSHVWHPPPAQRLLLVLAIAYTWVLSQSALHVPDEPLSPSRSAPRHSLFRRGLRWLRHQLHLHPNPAFFPDLFFLPFTPLIC
jgi:hypothetical protein